VGFHAARSPRAAGRQATTFRFIDVRPGERRLVLAAFLVQFGALAAHTILETARDALFLARIPASQLPWMYFAIAALAVLVTRPRAHTLARSRGLPALLCGCAAGTFLFWAAGSNGPWALRALYVWTGLVATLMSVAFWLLLGEIFTIAQARRLYGAIGLGTLLGAMSGGVLARAMAARFPAESLLAASAGVLAVTALGPARLLTAAAEALHQDAPGGAGIAPDPGAVRRHPYLVRVAGLVMLSTVAATLVDYVFKSTVARTVDASQLASFFASFYLALNALALAAQLLLAGRLMHVLGVTRALAILPLLLVPGALGVAAGAGLAGAILLRTADGALRPSLNRVGMELLFVPVPEALRSSTKPAIDVLGSRGGQCLASAFILAAIAWGGGTATIAAVAALACLVWMGVALGLQPRYLDVFRAALREGRLEGGSGLPALDVSSLQALLSALNSRSDGEVLASLELLEGQGCAHVVPAVLLHHPSRAVVLRTLMLLTQARRVDWLPVGDRLLESRDPEIRSAALRARTTVEPDESLLQRASEDPSALVRATAFAGLIGSGWDSEEVWRCLADLAAAPSLATRVALAEAIERQPVRAFEGLLLRLAQTPDEGLATHVARAMASVRSPAFLPTLLDWLNVRGVRDAAREALLAHGEEALRALDTALGDHSSPARVREHIPRTISLFPPEQAVAVLQRHLLLERDGRVRFKVLRGLGRIAADHPQVPLDDRLVGEATQRAVVAAVQALGWSVRLGQGAREVPSRVTAAHRLLVTLLRDREVHRIERFFRLLQLRYRKEDVRAIYRGLRNTDRRVRAASRELLENLLQEPLRSTVMALVDDLPDEERLSRTGRDPFVEGMEYRGLLRLIVDAGGTSLGSLAAYHAAELGLEVGPVAGPIGRAEAGRAFAASLPKAVPSSFARVQAHGI
jgi:AAA family ATP:ADP antiporter